MKLWWSLWLLDLVHAAKVRPSVVTAPLNLLVQEPGLEASNHTLFNTLGDKESALALMNATGEHHSAMFIDGGDEGIMEHDMDEHGMDAMDDFHEDHETDHGMDEHYDDHYDEHYDHDSHDDMHFDPEENSLALASEKGMSYLNSSMNSTSAMGWRCRHGCRSCKRWNRNWCTSCHNGWRKYGHKCHDKRAAATHFRIAGEAGHHDALMNLSRMFATGDGIPQDSQQAAQCIIKAAQAGDQMKELLQKISEGTLDPSTTTKLQEEMDRIRDRAQQMPGFMPGG